MSSIQIVPCEGVGVEIHGVDLPNITSSDLDTVKSAFSENGLVFFRDQDLSEIDHISFAEHFGAININRFFAAHPDHPQIAMVAKGENDRDNIGGGWHTDHSYDVEPALGSVLVARQLPTSGGDTRFTSMYRAYDTLPDELKTQIEGKRAIHSTRHIFGSKNNSYYQSSDSGKGRIGNSAAADAMQDVTHPIVITHPLSGKKALFVNPSFTIGIEGMEPGASTELLVKLYTHAMALEAMHQFQWRPGSVAFWDNRATWHWALNDYHGQARTMHRITIEGCALG